MAVVKMTTSRTSEHSLKGILNDFSAYGARSSLFVLKQITDTVDSVCTLEKFMRSMCEHTLSLAQSVHKEPKVLDSDDSIINALERVYQRLEDEVIPALERKRKSIDNDPELKAEHRSLLHSAYESFISSIEAWTESIKELRGAVINHDLAVEAGREPVFDSPEDLIRSIRQLASH